MLIKICQTCKKPFKASSTSPYIKFCSVECVDEAYENRQLDRETIDYAVKLVKKSQRERERERRGGHKFEVVLAGYQHAEHDAVAATTDIDTFALRELFFLEILKINRLLSEKEYESDKKEILDI